MDKQEQAETYREFATAVNMAPTELDEWLRTDFVGERVVADWVGARRSELTGLAHELGQNREEERSSLART